MLCAKCQKVTYLLNIFTYHIPYCNFAGKYMDQQVSERASRLAQDIA